MSADIKARGKKAADRTAEDNYKGYPDPSRVVSAEEATTLVGKKDVVFVDTRNYWKYVKGHIPGAINLELYAFHWVDTSQEGIEAFSREMAMLLGAFGIDREKEVIFYENESGYDAARGVWLLEWMGNKHGRLLDGGLRLWKKRGLPLSTKDGEPTRTKFLPKLDKGAISTLRELRRTVMNHEAAVIDSRSRGEFEGTHRRALKSGHMPRSINIEWTRAVRRDGTLKNAKQLLEVYKQVPAGTGLVTYCQSGYRAAHSWLILKLLGFENVKNYVGSWYEWGSATTTPVVK